MQTYYSKWLFKALLLALLLPASLLKAQILVDPGQTAAALAKKLAGQGVIVTNPVLHCSNWANGFFKVVSSNLGLDSGIVLTTGRAASSPGFYGVNGFSSGLASFDNGTPGDSTLTALAGQRTLDACTLEFDVMPAGDTISIDYVFSSEEYISAVCGPYNDAFAFFISGPGIAGNKNMALVPGTNIPVTINSINNGIPGSTGNLINCTSMGTGSPFTAYYKDNLNGNTLTHKGLTTILKAIYPVKPCVNYHLKIAIADAGNAKYDSGVFLEAGSLQSGHYSVEALTTVVRDTIAPICVKGCLPGRFHIKRTKSNSLPQTVKFVIAGTATYGVDFAPIADSVVIPAFATYADVTVNGLPTAVNGVRKLELLLLSPNNCGVMSGIIDSAVMLIYDTIRIAVSPADTAICGADSVRLKVSAADIYSYSWMPNINISGNSTQQPVVYPQASTVYTVTAWLPGTSCPFRTATATLNVKLTPHINLVSDTVVCGHTSFSLSPEMQLPNSKYSFGWTGPDGFTSNMLQPLLSNVLGADQGIYQLTVINDTNGCRAKASVRVVVTVVDTPGVTSPAIICLNTDRAALFAQGDNLVWYDKAGLLLGANTPLIPTDTLASYTYYVSNRIDNCESGKVELIAEVKKCCDGTIYIPNAFTPNGDGRNDKFRPVTDYGYFVKSMGVYNRWGQVVYSGNTGVWDGDFGSQPADADTYFYRIIFGCILGGTVERAGDIILIR